MAAATDRIKKTLEVTGALLGSVGALWLALGKGSNVFEHAFTQLGIPGPLAEVLGWGLPIAAITLLLIVAWRATISRSRIENPDRFELAAKHRNQIKGRDQDIRDLVDLIATYPLVFLVGESGSGKSAMVEAGLIPDVAAEGRIVPVLMRRYGSGWESGPLKETMLALWDALSEAERSALGIAIRPAPSTITLDMFTKTLVQIGARLGRQPLLIFDQFDDYQLAHRQQFTTEQGAWCDATSLESVNSFWQAVGSAIRSECTRCLIITRSDAAAGLESVRFVEDAYSRTRDLLRLRSEFLWPLLDGLAPSTADPPIVSDPGNGWLQLKAVLAEELHVGGLVLPQQVRTVALGLRSLNYLTVREYRSAGGATGLEARYVGRAISDCAKHCRVGADQIRTVLRAMVETAGRDSEAKTASRNTTFLRSFISDPEKLLSVLSELTRSELVRRVPNAESDEDEWQLDHDYLAQAVLHDEREQNRHAAILRDAAAAWRASAGDWRMRWRALLSLRVQIRLAWARIRPHSTFRYGTDADFARFSLLRTVKVLFAAALLLSGTWWYQITARAQSLVDSLESSLNDDDIIQLWASDSFVRDEVAAQLLAQPKKVAAIASGWMSAVVGLDSARANDLANQVLTKTIKEDDTGPVVRVVRELAPYLDHKTALRIANILTERLKSDDPAGPYIVGTLSQLYPVLGEEGLREAAAAALGRFSRVVPTSLTSNGKLESNSRLASSECKALQSLLPAFSKQADVILAQLLADRLLNGEASLYSDDCVLLYSDLGVRARGRNEDIDPFSATLKTYFPRIPTGRLPDEEIYVGARYAAISAWSRLDPSDANRVLMNAFDAWRHRFEQDCFRREYVCATRTDSFKFSSLTRRIAEFGPSLTAVSATNLALYIVATYRDTAQRQVDAVGRDSFSLVQGLQALVLRLDETGADAVTDSLRQDLHTSSSLSLLDPRSVFGGLNKSLDAYGLLGSIGARMSPSAASSVLGDLLPELDGTDRIWIEHMLSMLASRLDRAASRRLAETLLDHLQVDNGEQLFVLGKVVYALSENQLLSLNKTLLSGLHDRHSKAALSELSGTLGQSCQALAAYAIRRRLAVECMLLAASFPVRGTHGSTNEPNGYSWDKLRTFASLPAASDVSAIIEWARENVDVNSEDIRPLIIREHFERH